MTDNRIDNLSIDCVIFGFEEGELKVLLIERNTEPQRGMMALPGGFIRLDEELDNASHRILKEMTGLDNVFMEQVQTFGAVDRYPLRRVITIVYYALVKIDEYMLSPKPDGDAKEAKWVKVKDLPPLPFDHKLIFDSSLEKLQERVRNAPIGFNLLPEKFSISELQLLYEGVLQTEFDKRNFRKKLAKMNLLVDLNEKQQNVAHRAAKLYKFDEDVYESLRKKGFHFDL
jgi:8-oxo-dGTP diphosphatase